MSEEDEARGAQLRTLLPKPHTEPPAAIKVNIPSSAPTRRQSRCPACVPCQLAKNRCDGARPKCSRCIKKNVSDCTYRERNVRANRKRLEQENQLLRRQLAQNNPSNGKRLSTSDTPEALATPGPPAGDVDVKDCKSKFGLMWHRRLSSLSESTPVGDDEDEDEEDDCPAMDELRLYKRVLSGVFQAIRGEKSQRIFELIRDDATVEQIADFIDYTEASEAAPNPASSPTNFRFVEYQSTPAQDTILTPVTTQSPMGLLHPVSMPYRYSYQMEQLPSLLHPREPGGQADNDVPVGVASPGPLMKLSPHSGTPPLPQDYSDSALVYPNSSIRQETPHPLAFERMTHEPPPHELVPPHADDSSLLDNFSKLYTSFCDAAHEMIGQGVPVDDVLGAEGVTVDVLLRGRRPEDQHTVCTWASSVARSFEGSDFLVRLGYAFLIARFVRWVVSPTAHNYALLPELMRPTELQYRVAHFPCIDLAIFPVWRDSLIGEMQDFTRACHESGVEVLWPYAVEDAVTRNPHDNTIEVSKMFADHVSDTRNWRWGSKVLDLFPESDGLLNIANEHQLVPKSKEVPPIVAGESVPTTAPPRVQVPATA